MYLCIIHYNILNKNEGIISKFLSIYYLIYLILRLFDESVTSIRNRKWIVKTKSSTTKNKIYIISTNCILCLFVLKE